MNTELATVAAIPFFLLFLSMFQPCTERFQIFLISSGLTILVLAFIIK